MCDAELCDVGAADVDEELVMVGVVFLVSAGRPLFGLTAGRRLSHFLDLPFRCPFVLRTSSTEGDWTPSSYRGCCEAGLGLASLEQSVPSPALDAYPDLLGLDGMTSAEVDDVPRAPLSCCGDGAAAAGCWVIDCTMVGMTMANR